MAPYKITSAAIADGAVGATQVDPDLGFFPTGGIIMWSGSIASIPNGWALCNGQTVGALTTPDLRNRFIVGAESDLADTTYPGLSPNATGGSADAIVVEHTHSITDPGHSHTESYNTPSSGQDQAGSGSGDNDNTSTKQTSTETTGITIDSEGVSGTNANLPPYYALAFIMKV